MYAASLPFALTFASIAAFTSGIFLLVARVAGALRGAPKVVVRLLGAVAAMMALIWIRTAIVSTGHE